VFGYYYYYCCCCCCCYCWSVFGVGGYYLCALAELCNCGWLCVSLEDVGACPHSICLANLCCLFCSPHCI
jgi:hypothetical protein